MIILEYYLLIFKGTIFWISTMLIKLAKDSTPFSSGVMKKSDFKTRNAIKDC